MQPEGLARPHAGDAATASEPAVPVAARVAVERARLVFEQTRPSGIAKLPYAALNVWLLHDHVPAWLLSVWVALLCVTTVLRVWLDYQRTKAAAADAPLWLTRYRWVLAADGFVLGLIAFGDYQNPQSALSIMLTAAVIGCEAVAYSTLNVHFEAMLMHLLPALLPMTVWHLWRGTDAGLYLGLGALMFTALLVSGGWRVYRHTGEMLRLRFQMDEVAAQRARALAEAQNSNAVKSRFLAMMSHEVRTPLHGMLGLARSMRGHLQRGHVAAGAEQLETLRVTGEHLITVINDALDLSALEHRQFSVNPQEFDLGELLQDVARLARAAALEKGLEFELSGVSSQPMWVRADPARLRQILLNLTGNAVKFTDHGFVRLSLDAVDTVDAIDTLETAARLPARVRLSVSDTGTGIDAEHLESIFEPYRRFAGGYGRHYEGTGLGLTIARELARAMGGELVCDSVRGQGSTFRLALPLPVLPARPTPSLPAAASVSAANVSAANASPAIQSSADESGPHVLLVDDNRLNAYVAEFMLEKAGMSYESVSDGAQAVERALGGGFDLILMDCQMPEVDGFEATRRIRAFEVAQGRPAVPIVALTANALDADRERSFAAGMNAHLSKPFNAEELVAVVRHTLSRSSHTQSCRPGC